jgi:hypothetical protein
MPGASDGPQMPGLAQACTPGTQFAVAGERSAAGEIVCMAAGHREKRWKQNRMGLLPLSFSLLSLAMGLGLTTATVCNTHHTTTLSSRSWVLGHVLLGNNAEMMQIFASPEVIMAT